MTPEITENYALVVYLDVPLDMRMICMSKKKVFLHMQKKEPRRR